MDSEDRKVLQFPRKGTPANYGPDALTVGPDGADESGAPIPVETVKTYGCRGCNAPPRALTQAEADGARERGHELYVVGDEPDGQSVPCEDVMEFLAGLFGGRTPEESGIPGDVGVSGDEPAVLRVTIANVTPEDLIEVAEGHGLYGTAWRTVGNSQDGGHEYGATIEFGGAIVSRVKPFVLAVLRAFGERQAYVTRNGQDAILANADGSDESLD